MSPLDVPPAVFGLGTARLLGGAAVVVLMLGFLYVVLRHGSSRDRGVDDDAATMPSRGPAYGAGGSDVEEILQAAQGEDGADGGDGGAGDGADTADPGDDAGDGADGLGPPEVLDHEVISRREDELLVEVTDGDRVGRFYVETPGANPSVSSASPGTDRHDEAWRHTAADYLRAVALAGDFEEEADVGWE